MTEEDDVVRVQGAVAQNLPNTMFKVGIDGGLVVLAHVSGKMRMRKDSPGDREDVELEDVELEDVELEDVELVDVELSAYDPTKGRIVWRYR